MNPDTYVLFRLQTIYQQYWKKSIYRAWLIVNFTKTLWVQRIFPVFTNLNGKSNEVIQFCLPISARDAYCLSY
jgi:hypothetical protein